VPWADHMLVPLPDGLDPIAVASLSDNICDGWRTVAPVITDPPNESLLFIADGAPSMPFYGIAIAKALGVERVDYLDLDADTSADRLEKASRLGANIVESPDAVRSGTYTATVCSTGHRDGLRVALRATDADGTCTVNVTPEEPEVPIPLFLMYTFGVHLVTGRVNARMVIPKALELILDGSFRPQDVTDAVVPWNEVADALV